MSARGLESETEIVRVQTVIVVGDDVSDAPALTTECRCWGSSERDGGRWPDGPQYFVTLATYFFAPLCAGS